MDRKKIPLPISMKENSICNIVLPLFSLFFLFIFFTVALQMFVGHISVEKLNITIYHLQISENASSFFLFLFFYIKQKFDTLVACMRTVWSAFKLCRYKPVAAADTIKTKSWRKQSVVNLDLCSVIRFHLRVCPSNPTSHFLYLSILAY